MIKIKKLLTLLFLILLAFQANAQNENGKFIKGTNLLITDVDVVIDGSSSRNLEYNEEIDGIAEPKSVIQFQVELTNNHTNQTMNDVFIRVSIEEINNNKDIEETSDEQEIDPERNEDFEVEFTLPDVIDSGEYEVIIIAEGDLNDTDQEIEFLLDLVAETDEVLQKQEESLTASLTIVNQTINELKNEVNYFEPYTTCTSDKSALEARLQEKDTLITELQTNKAEYLNCENEQLILETDIDQLETHIDELEINQSNLKAQVKRTRDNKNYIILGIIIAALGGFYFYRKQKEPESESQEEK